MLSVVLIEAEETSCNRSQMPRAGKKPVGIWAARISTNGYFRKFCTKIGSPDDMGLVRKASTALLYHCEQVKEQLSQTENASFQLDPTTGLNLKAEFTRAAFEELLDRNDFFSVINQLVRQALSAAAERGYREEDIRAVLMVGGSSQIPSVQRTLRQIFWP